MKNKLKPGCLSDREKYYIKEYYKNDTMEEIAKTLNKSQTCVQKCMSSIVQKEVEAEVKSRVEKQNTALDILNQMGGRRGKPMPIVMSASVSQRLEKYGKQSFPGLKSCYDTNGQPLYEKMKK